MLRTILKIIFENHINTISKTIFNVNFIWILYIYIYVWFDVDSILDFMWILYELDFLACRANAWNRKILVSSQVKATFVVIWRPHLDSHWGHLWNHIEALICFETWPWCNSKHAFHMTLYGFHEILYGFHAIWYGLYVIWYGFMWF